MDRNIIPGVVSIKILKPGVAKNDSRRWYFLWPKLDNIEIGDVYLQQEGYFLDPRVLDHITYGIFTALVHLLGSFLSTRCKNKLKNTPNFNENGININVKSRDKYQYQWDNNITYIGLAYKILHYHLSVRR